MLLWADQHSDYNKLEQANLRGDEKMTVARVEVADELLEHRILGTQTALHTQSIHHYGRTLMYTMTIG